jgi:hypothetical protein
VTAPNSQVTQHVGVSAKLEEFLAATDPSPPIPLATTLGTPRAGAERIRAKRRAGATFRIGYCQRSRRGDAVDRAAIWARFDNHIRSTNGHEVFSANSLLDLLGWINNGVELMVDDGRTSEEDLSAALSNFDNVMAAMGDVRSEAGVEHFTEESVNAAFARLCPIFPFCR